MEFKRVAVYLRGFEDKKNGESYHIDRELERILKECKDQGKIVVKEYIDCDISDKTIESSLALKNMLDDCDKDIFDEIVVLKLNRLTRNPVDLANTLDVFDRNQITLCSVDEGIDTSELTGMIMINTIIGILGLLQSN